MSDLDLDFNSEEFGHMSVTDRVKACRLFAHRARQLADGSPDRKEAYLRIAAQWDILSNDIEQHG